MGEIKKCAMTHLCDDTHPGWHTFLGSKHSSHPPSAGESMGCVLGGIYRMLEYWNVGLFGMLYRVGHDLYTAS